MATVVEEEENLIDVGVHTIEIDCDDFVVEAVISILIAFQVVSTVMKSPSFESTLPRGMP